MSNEPSAPYLSVVVTSRNDNHGGTLTRRMQTFVNALVAQCRRHNVPTELIFVEWNPPGDKPKLAEALRWPADMSPCVVRIIEVPPEIHARYQHAKELPLYQFIAKNVGIRRARGQYVLATNIDVLLNHELMAFIAAGKMEKGRMYRIDRHDVETFVPEDGTIDQMLDYCNTHLLRVNAREGTYAVDARGLRMAEAVDVIARDSGLSLGAGWFDAVPLSANFPDKVFRFVSEACEVRIEPTAITDAGTSPYLIVDIQPGPGLGDRPFTLIAQTIINGAPREVARAVVMARCAVSIPLPTDAREPFLITFQLDGKRKELPGDPRALQAWVYKVELRDQPAERAVDRDVFPVSRGLAAGGGWVGAEIFQGGYIRWLRGDAEIFFSTSESASRYVVLDVEAGPSIGGRPFFLRALDDAGHEFSSAHIMRRQKVAIPVESQAGGLRKFVLRVDAPFGLVDDHGLQVLVRSADFVDASPTELEAGHDVFPADLSIAAGSGWYAAEMGSGVNPHGIRWLKNDAEIWYSLSDGDPRRYIVLDLEPGMALRYRPTRLRVMDDERGEFFSTVLMGRQRISIPVQPTGGALRRFVIHVGRPEVKASDGRLLSALLTRVELATEPAINTDCDVFPASLGLSGGDGWYPVEGANGQHSRWLSDPAEIWFTAPSSQSEPVTRYVVLHLEPGPAVDRRPFVLRAVDEDGQDFFSSVISDGRPAVIPVEFTPGRLSHFTLHYTTFVREHDGRSLGALLRKVEVLDHAPTHDIAPDFIAFGDGWYGTEPEKDGLARWMCGVGELVIDSAGFGDVPVEIRLDLEAGASVARQTDLIFRDDTGVLLHQTTLVRRQTVAFKLPAGRRQIRVTIDCGTKGAALLDGRVLLVLARSISLVKSDGAPIALASGVARPSENNPSLPAESQIQALPPLAAAAETMVPSPHADIVAPIYLHNNACGDFTLMHRDHWFEIRGHAEWDAFSIHLDSLLCFCAHHSGAVETMLAEPMRCYHIEHSVGSGWTPEGMDRLLRRIRLAGIRDVDWREVGQIGVILRRYNSPVSFSPSDWGLVNETLPETVIEH